jgi:hypothetical protein
VPAIRRHSNTIFKYKLLPISRTYFLESKINLFKYQNVLSQQLFNFKDMLSKSWNCKTAPRVGTGRQVVEDVGLIMTARVLNASAVMPAFQPI